MKEHKDIFFTIFLIIVIILAILYFSVPERKLFIENQIKWWKELWDIVIK